VPISSCRHILTPAMLLVMGLSLGGCGFLSGEGLETADNSSKKVASVEEKDCLVRAMYFEANRSSDAGLLAVGSVVMNRVESGQYPSTICGVVGQPKQFAPGVLKRAMAERDKPRVEKVADAILSGERHPRLNRAMYFHIASRRYHYPNMKYVLVAGGNIFYEKTSRRFTTLASVQDSIDRAQTFDQKPLVVAMSGPHSRYSALAPSSR
jgi:spore germination cell wall hydrolase CwlJ-like protein